MFKISLTLLLFLNFLNLAWILLIRIRNRSLIRNRIRNRRKDCAISNTNSNSKRSLLPKNIGINSFTFPGLRSRFRIRVFKNLSSTSIPKDLQGGKNDGNCTEKLDD